MHHQCVAPLAANSSHSGLSRAISIASSKVRSCRDRSFFRVAIHEEWGRPTGLLRSLWGTAVRILLASADSSILIRCPNNMSLLFCMIEVRRGCLVRRRTSQLETWWYQRISATIKSLLRTLKYQCQKIATSCPLPTFLTYDVAGHGSFSTECTVLCSIDTLSMCPQPAFSNL